MLAAIGTAVTTLSSTVGKIEPISNAFSSVSDSATNFFGATAGICGPHLSDEAIALVRRHATATDEEFAQLERRWQRSNESEKYGKNLRTAPLDRVGAWLRFDCKSAGSIRQDMSNDMKTLLARYGHLATSGGNETAPQFVGQPVTDTQTDSRIVEELKEFLRDTRDDAIANAADGVGDLAQPAASRVSSRLVADALPEILIGAAIAFVVFKIARG